MPKPVNIYEAKTHLSELVERAQKGKEIVISKAGRPVARLVPLDRVAERRVPGHWAGKVRIGEDFDAPLPESVLDEFEGTGE